MTLTITVIVWFLALVVGWSIGRGEAFWQRTRRQRAYRCGWNLSMLVHGSGPLYLPDLGECVDEARELGIRVTYDDLRRAGFSLDRVDRAGFLYGTNRPRPPSPKDTRDGSLRGIKPPKRWPRK